MKRTAFIALLVTLALACGAGDAQMQQQDVTHLQKALGLPDSAQCEGTSTWGGTMGREGLRIEIACKDVTPSWRAGPVPAIALAQNGIDAPLMGSAQVTMHTCTAYTLAQPNSNLFTGHPCDPWPENTMKVELGAVRDGTVFGVYRAWF